MPDVGLIQALMNQAQQVMQQTQPSEKGGFQKDQNGLDFLGNMMAQEKPKFEEAADQFAGEFAFAAVPISVEYKQNLVTQFEGALTETPTQMQSTSVILPEVESATAVNTEAVEKSFQQPQPETLLTETANQNQKSLFIQGITGEVKLVDESITPELGLALPNDATDTGPIQYVGPDGTPTDLNPYQALTPEAKAAVDQDKTLTVIQNEEGQMELAPYQESQNPDLDFGSETSPDSNSTLDLSIPSSDSRAPTFENQKEPTFVAELQAEGPSEITEINPSINVEAKTGDAKFEGTLKTEATQRPQVMDQIFAKMDFPSLKQKGEQKISIVLDPQELGRVDVELQIDGDKVNAVFKADQQALHYAKDDAHKLLQMLKDQGFNASAQDFQFQERPSESHYAQENFAYGNFSVEETEIPAAPHLTQQIYNRSVSGGSYDAVI